MRSLQTTSSRQTAARPWLSPAGATLTQTMRPALPPCRTPPTRRSLPTALPVRRILLLHATFCRVCLHCMDCLRQGNRRLSLCFCAGAAPGAAQDGAPRHFSPGMTADLAAEIHRQSLAAPPSERGSEDDDEESSSSASAPEDWVVEDEGRLVPGRHTVSVGHLTHEQ